RVAYARLSWQAFRWRAGFRFSSTYNAGTRSGFARRGGDLAALEDGCALFDKGLRGFRVVGGLGAAGMVEGLGVEGEQHVAFLRRVEGLLQQALGNAGAAGEALREGEGFSFEFLAVDSAVHDAEA